MFYSAFDFLNEKKERKRIIIPKNPFYKEKIKVLENNKEKFLEKIDGKEILGELVDFVLNPVQTAFVNYYKGENTIVTTPTGSGKTFTFYYAVFYKNLKKTIYISPTRALANQIYRELKKTKLKVFLKTGEYNLEVPKEYDIVVCTAESFVVACRNKKKWVFDSELVVFDEIHVITHELRSIAYEEALIYTKELNKRLLLLSATIYGIEELANWLNISLIIQSEWRPIPLERRFYNIKTPNEKNIKEFVDELLKEILLKNFKENNKTILVVPSKKLGWLILEELEKKGFRAINETVPFSKRVNGEIRTAFHNADIPKEERELIEETFIDKNSKLTLLISTQTLALGFNSPADDVIIIVKNLWGEIFPNILDILQFEGRAGRLGYTKRGKGIVHYIIGKGDKLKDSLTKELSNWKNKKFTTVLEQNFNFLLSFFLKNEEKVEEIFKKLLEEEIFLYFKENLHNKELKNLFLSLDSVLLILLGLMTNQKNLIEHSFFFYKIKNSEKLKNVFFRLLNKIKKILEEKRLVVRNKLTTEGKLISTFYINPISYFLFKNNLENFLRFYNNEFWVVWNLIPFLLKIDAFVPYFYPTYYELEIPDEIFNTSSEIHLNLLMYAIGYYGEYFNLEIIEQKDKVDYHIYRLRPPVWTVNLYYDIPRIIGFLKKLVEKKIININLKEEEWKKIEFSFVYGVHPDFSLLSQIKNIGYVKIFLLKEFAKIIGAKNEKELFEKLKEKEIMKEEVFRDYLKEKYLKKIKYLVEEKYKTNIINEKILSKLENLIKRDMKELKSAIKLLLEKNNNHGKIIINFFKKL